MLSSTPASPETPCPIQTLPLPLILEPASAPKAMLKLPVVLFASELTPRAVLELPVVLKRSASKPLAVWILPHLRYAAIKKRWSGRNYSIEFSTISGMPLRFEALVRLLP